MERNSFLNAMTETRRTEMGALLSAKSKRDLNAKEELTQLLISAKKQMV